MKVEFLETTCEIWKLTKAFIELLNFWFRTCYLALAWLLLFPPSDVLTHSKWLNSFEWSPLAIVLVPACDINYLLNEADFRSRPSYHVCYLIAETLFCFYLATLITERPMGIILLAPKSYFSYCQLANTLRLFQSGIWSYKALLRKSNSYDYR